MSWSKPGDPIETPDDADRVFKWVEGTVVASGGGGGGGSAVIHSDHTHIAVSSGGRGGAGIVIPDYWADEYPTKTTYTYAKCDWCGYRSTKAADRLMVGVAYFPEDEAIHCIPTERCYRRLRFRAGLLLGEVLQVKRENNTALLTALLPE
jgi:hypothetical protein